MSIGGLSIEADHVVAAIIIGAILAVWMIRKGFKSVLPSA